MATKLGLLVNEADTVLVAVEAAKAGDWLYDKGKQAGVVVTQDIPQGHKAAFQAMAKGEPVVKFGIPIGLADQDITPGQWVHCHNVLDITEELLAKQREQILSGEIQFDYHTRPYKSQAPALSRQMVMGYPRADGRFGIRNYVIVISLVQCSNTAAQKIAGACGDIPAIVVEAACGEFAERFARTRQGFVSAGIHPNVYGVLLLSLGCQQADPQDIADEIGKHGKEVHQLCIQTDGGQTKVIEKGIELVKGMQQRASEQERVPCPIDGLVLCAYNGGSDWTSGVASNPVAGDALDIHDSWGGTIVSSEGLGRFAYRASTLEIARQVVAINQRINEDTIARSGKGVSSFNLLPGNKAGGLTTQTEKDTGTGMVYGHGKLRYIMEPGEIPQGRGVWGINQPQGANDAYHTTNFSMSGAHVCFFTTGRGTPIGNAVMPCIKLTANPNTSQNLGEMIDFSTVDVLQGESTIEQAGLRLYEKLLDVCDGELTCAEKLHDWSYTIPHGTSYNGDYDKPCEKNG